MSSTLSSFRSSSEMENSPLTKRPKRTAKRTAKRRRPIQPSPTKINKEQDDVVDDVDVDVDGVDDDDDDDDWPGLTDRRLPVKTGSRRRTTNQFSSEMTNFISRTIKNCLDAQLLEDNADNDQLQRQQLFQQLHDKVVDRMGSVRTVGSFDGASRIGLGELLAESRLVCDQLKRELKTVEDRLRETKAFLNAEGVDVDVDELEVEETFINNQPVDLKRLDPSDYSQAIESTLNGRCGCSNKTVCETLKANSFPVGQVESVNVNHQR